MDRAKNIEREWLCLADPPLAESQARTCRRLVGKGWGYCFAEEGDERVFFFRSAFRRAGLATNYPDLLPGGWEAYCFVDREGRIGRAYLVPDTAGDPSVMGVVVPDLGRQLILPPFSRT